jgi:hypothetical protein
MLVHAYNPSTWEAEAGRLQVPAQPGLQSRTLSQKKKKDKKQITGLRQMGFAISQLNLGK